MMISKLKVIKMKIFISVLFFLLISALPLYAKDWYVRPRVDPAPGETTVYGTEDGTSYENAWNGLENVKFGTSPGEVQPDEIGPGDTLWVCGLHVYEMTNPGNIATQATVNVITGIDENTRTIIRGDYPGDPGIVWGAYLDSTLTWQPEPGYANVWSATLNANYYPDWFFEDVTASSFRVLDKKDSIAAVAANPGSHYSPDYHSGSKIYIQCSDSGNPTGRILFNRYGYKFRIFSNSYITFKNITFYAPAPFWISNDRPTHIRLDGCRFIYGESRMFSIFDGMDYMEILNCEIAWAGNGIYNISLTNNAPSYYTYKGNYIHDIGVREITQNGDAHAIGIQGGHDGLIEGNLCVNTGTGPLLYAYTNQEVKNNIVRYNYVKNPHTLQASSYGISTQCNNDSLSDKSGNKFYYNIVEGAEVGYRMQFESEQEVYNNIAYNCKRGFVSSRSVSLLKFSNGLFPINQKDVVVGVTSGAAGRVGGIKQFGTAPNITGSLTYSHLYNIKFASGGPTELRVGDDIRADSSGILCTVRNISLTSGSWALGNAEGSISVNKEAGTFVENETFSIEGGQSDILTMVGTAARIPFQAGEDITVNGVRVGTLTDVTYLGPRVKVMNNIIYNSENYHVQISTGGSNTTLIFDNNLYYPDGPHKFTINWRESDFAGWQAQYPFWINPQPTTGFIFDPHGMVADPLFVAPNQGNFHLQPTSPAIHAGVDVGLPEDYAGNQIIPPPSIGAYEYIEDLVPPTQVDAEEGGTVTVTDGEYAGTEVDIPPGALSGDTTITVSVETNPPNLPAAMEDTAVIISVSSSEEDVVLEEPVTFTIPYQGDTPPDVVYYFNADDQTWYIVTGEVIVDEVNKLVTFENSEFTAYGVGDTSTILDRDSGGGGGGGGGCFIKMITGQNKLRHFH